MAETVKRTRVNFTASAAAPGPGHPALRNEILLALPPTERARILSNFEPVSLPARTVLARMGQPIDFAYFPNTGVISIITDLSGGKGVEVGLTGNEGFVGLPLIVGYRTSPTRAIVQIAIDAYKIPASSLQSILRGSPKLKQSLERYSQDLSIQAIQIAACNRLHEVDERLARWLLMSHDRVERSTFPLTQEFISHMLGTRRASVTVAAGILQKAGLITYRRGQVTIKDRARLEDAACECYARIKRQIEQWHQVV